MKCKVDEQTQKGVCKVDEQTQKGVRRVKNDKRRGRNFTMEKFLKQRVNLYSWPSWNVRVALER